MAIDPAGFGAGDFGEDFYGKFMARASSGQALPTLAQTVVVASKVAAQAAQVLPLLTQAAALKAKAGVSAAPTLPVFSQNAFGRVYSPVIFKITQDLPSIVQEAYGAVLVAAVADQTLPGLTQAVAGRTVFWGDAIPDTPGDWWPDDALPGDPWVPRPPSGGDWLPSGAAPVDVWMLKPPPAGGWVTGPEVPHG